MNQDFSIFNKIIIRKYSLIIVCFITNAGFHILIFYSKLDFNSKLLFKDLKVKFIAKQNRVKGLSLTPPHKNSDICITSAIFLGCQIFPSGKYFLVPLKKKQSWNCV